MAQRVGASAHDVIRKTYFIDTGHSNVGCKILASQVSDDDLRCLLSIDRLRVVIIRRRNIVRQFVSEAIARRDELWMQPVGDKRSDVTDRRVHVDVQELLRFRSRMQDWYDRYRQMSKGLAVLETSYEELTSNLDHEVQRVAEFIGAGESSRPTDSRMRRQNPEPLSELIENYEDVRRELLALGEQALVADLDA